MISVAEFNGAAEEEALALLDHACHSRYWVDAMLAARPFGDLDTLLKTAAQLWSGAEEPAILEAFTGHARIGDLNALRDKYSPASKEQGQVAAAEDEVFADLLALNRDYEARHGFIFIVCATGKSAGEMRDLLRERLPNDRQTELANGAREQGAITQLRLLAAFTDNSMENEDCAND